MSIYDFINISKIMEFVLWFIIPVWILVSCYLHKRFLSTVQLIYFILSIPIIGYYEGPLFSLIYIIVFAHFALWWSRVFQKYKEENPKNYEEYRYFYNEYFSDDLNDDGIKDAFENWEIAHDPRFFWLFGSRKAKREKELERAKKGSPFGDAMGSGFNSANSKAWEFQSQFNAWNYRYNRKTGQDRATDNRDYRNTSSTGGNSRSSAYYDNIRRQQNYQQRYNNPGQAASDEGMSDVEREVAKQHEFARKYNLRYFAMCKSKSEAKKLYHKYAAKFHPDNAVTGDKEKFVRIDEEYNRFCQIGEIS